MINMISAAKLTKFSKQREAPPENFQTDTKQKDFASFLNSPASQAKKSAHKSKLDKADKVPDEMHTEQDTQEITGSIISTETQKIPLTQSAESQNLPGAKPSISVNDKAPATVPVQEALPKDLSATKGDPALFANAEALIRKGIESGKIEVLESPENKTTFASQNNLSLAGKGDFADHLPKLFGEVSNLLKNENSARVKASDSLSELGLEVNFSDKPQTADQLKLNSSDGNALNFYQPETEKLKAEKSLESTTDFSSIGFNKVLNSVAKEQKLSDAAPEVPVKPGEVLEQVEAKLIRLINLDKSENEKKVMKMRLHPAELGAVEIKLEKNSDGKLHAHFQTESETTKQILTENLAQLRDSLHKSGWQIEHLEISCSSFSSAENGSRENASRQFETAENQPTGKTVSGNSADMPDDSKQNSSNRLLSVRA